MASVNIIYLVLSLLLFIGILTSTFSARLGLPLLVVFLGVGMLAGEDGILHIQFEGFYLANMIGQGALAVILLDGGLRTPFSSFRIAIKPSVVLATWGVICTVLITGLFITAILRLSGILPDIDWRYGFLMAAIVGSTDAAAVFSLLRNGGVRLNARVQSTLEIESGANDPIAILLVMGFIGLTISPDKQNPLDFAILLLQQLGFGLSLGLIAGYLLSRLLAYLHLPDGLYAILIFSAGIAVFALTNLLGGSGFLAIYLAGVIIGNRKTRTTEHVLLVMDGVAWLAQAVLLVMLGLLVKPSSVLDLWPIVLALALFMIFIARPIAVFSSLIKFRFSRQEMSFISWVGLRGAVPVTLAIIPVMMNVPHAKIFFDLAFGVVLVSLLLQGTTLPFMAKFFRVILPPVAEATDEHEIWMSNKSHVNIYEFKVKANAFAINRHPEGIAKRLDEDAVRFFTLLRKEEIVPVTATTALKEGDRVWYIVKGDQAKTLAKLFNDSFFTRQTQNDFFGEWVVSPNALLKNLPNLNNDNLTEDQLQMTVNECILASGKKLAVIGDRAKINDEYELIVRETDNKGEITAVGLKQITATE